MTDQAMTTGSVDGARYAAVQRWLHWAIAVLVLASLGGGATIWAFGGYTGLADTLGNATAGALYKYHKTSGVLVLGLMVLRVGARYAHGAPAMPASMPGWQARIARATHLAFYGLILAMAVLGWAATATGDFPIQFFDMTLPKIFPVNKPLSETLYLLHGLVGLAIALLAALHIGAAVRHWKVEKDGVMRRISLP